MSRFSYVRYDGVRAQKQQEAKALVEAVEAFIDKMGTGRQLSLALTALEECYMWIGKAIRDEQIAFDGALVEEPLRGEEGVNVEPKGALCGLCGKPMPKGEEMFNYHGYSGPCPD